MNTRSAVLLGLLTLAAPAFAAEKKAEAAMLEGQKIELARYAKSFIGPDNVTVDVAPYKRGGKEGAILLIKGVEGPWDGMAIKHDVRPAARNGKDYTTRYKGSDWNTLVMREDYGSPNYELYVPDVQNGIKLAPSDGGAQLTTPQAILKEYEKQQAEKAASK